MVTDGILKKATLLSWDNVNYLATIMIQGSSATIPNVPVARNILDAQMIINRNLAVIFFDQSNPKDAVVIAVYIA